MNNAMFIDILTAHDGFTLEARRARIEGGKCRRLEKRFSSFSCFLCISCSYQSGRARNKTTMKCMHKSEPLLDD